jgi:threonine dehydrogenase-like Zn-dependent dehydrogenase
MTGRTVAILGAGTIGLLTLAAVRRAGARRVVSTDMVPHKREMALFMGADAVVDGAEEDLVGSVRAALGESGDVIFDCVATEKTVGQAIRIAIKGGTVVVVGGARRPVTIDLPIVQEYQVRVQGSTTYLREDLEQAIEVLKSPGFDASVFVTATFPLSRASDAFAAIDTGQQVKILVTASEEGSQAGPRLPAGPSSDGAPPGGPSRP